MLTLCLLWNGYNDLPSWSCTCIICILHLNLQTYLKYNQVFPRNPSSCPWYRWSVYSPTNCIQRYSPLPVVYRSQQAVSHWLLGRNWSYRVVQYTCLKIKLSPSSPCSDYLSTDSHFATCVPSFMWYLSLLPIRGRSQIFEDDVFSAQLYSPIVQVGSSLEEVYSVSWTQVIILSPELRVNPSTQSTNTSVPFFTGNTESVFRCPSIGNSVQDPVNWGINFSFTHWFIISISNHIRKR